MALAIFDLDNTLLGGDSDHAWGEFACEIGIVDADTFGRQNDAFFADYQAGQLDINAYLRHALSPLAGQTLEQAALWHQQFMQRKIIPMLLPAADELVRKHRQQGDNLLVITATNRFVTEPIVRHLGITQLLACEAEIINGRYTGEPAGTPSYGAGKVSRLQDWLEHNDANLTGSVFYSDSHNDLPLLEAVENPVAVDPDERLLSIATGRNWPVISLRD